MGKEELRAFQEEETDREKEYAAFGVQGGPSGCG